MQTEKRLMEIEQELKLIKEQVDILRQLQAIKALTEMPPKQNTIKLTDELTKRNLEHNAIDISRLTEIIKQFNIDKPTLLKILDKIEVANKNKTIRNLPAYTYSTIKQYLKSNDYGIGS